MFLSHRARPLVRPLLSLRKQQILYNSSSSSKDSPGQTPQDPLTPPLPPGYAQPDQDLPSSLSENNSTTQKVPTPIQSQPPPGIPIPGQPTPTPIQTRIPPKNSIIYQAAEEAGKRRDPDFPRGVFWTILAAVVLLPPGIYWYYGYRKERMDQLRRGERRNTSWGGWFT